MLVKGLITIALIAYPEKAKAAREWIDGKVNTAVQAVNDAAEVLKKATDAILDWVGKTLDTLLKYVQTAWNIALSVLQLIATGQFKELYEKLKNLGRVRGMAWE